MLNPYFLCPIPYAKTSLNELGTAPSSTLRLHALSPVVIFLSELVMARWGEGSSRMDKDPKKPF